MAITIRLKDFTPKITPTGADIIYMGDSADNFNEVQVTVDDLMGILPGGVTEDEVQQSAFNTGLDTGIADAYVIALNPVFISYTDGLPFQFTPVYANATTTPTLDAGAGAKTMVLSNGAVGIGDIAPTMLCAGFYSLAADSFIVITPAVS